MSIAHWPLPMCDVIRPCENSWSHLLLYQIEWNVGHKQIGHPASQIYKHPNHHHKRCCSVRFYGICKLMNMNLRSSDHDLKIKFGTFCRRRPNISPVTGVRKNLFGTLSTEKSLEFGQKPNRGRLSGSPHPFITIDHMMKWNNVYKHQTILTNGLHLNLPSICFSFLVDVQGLDIVWRFSGRSLPLVGGGGGSWPNVMQCVTR